MADTPNYTKLVPGFEFLQSLAKTAGSALPNMGQWVAPTLSPEELEKRINELRTVQFWLEQNAKMLGATIQALEVQRMTLSTLKTMNVQMGDLRDALMVKPGSAPTAPGWPARQETTEPKAQGTSEGATVDPMQWWAALTKQFTELATSTMKESAAKAADTMSAMRSASSPEAAAQPQASAGSPNAGTADAGHAADAAEAAKSAARRNAQRKPLR